MTQRGTTSVTGVRGFFPRIDPSIPPEVQRHLQLIYQKLDNHARAFELIQPSVSVTVPVAQPVSVGQTVVTPSAAAPSLRHTRPVKVGQYDGIPGEITRHVAPVPRQASIAPGAVVPSVVTRLTATSAPGISENAYIAVDAAYTITKTDFQVDCTSGTFTVTLPSAAGIQGQAFSVKNSGTGTITLAAASGQTIDGAAAQMLTSLDNLVVMSTGTNWIILLRY